MKMAKATVQKKGSGHAGDAGAMMRDLELLKEYLLFVNAQIEEEAPGSEQSIDIEYYNRILESIKSRDGMLQRAIDDLHKYDDIIDRHGARQNALIQILLDIQDAYHWLPENGLRRVQQRLDVPWSRIYQIATFYKAFQLIPQGRHLVQVCLGTACQVRNAPRLLDQVSDILKIHPGETDKEGKYTLGTVHCMGCCALGPVMTVDGVYFSRRSTDELKKIFASYK